MISQGSVSFPVSSFSTSRRNCSFGSTRALCTQGAQSKPCPWARTNFASSRPFVQPTCFRFLSHLRGQVFMDRHQVIGFSSRFGKPPLQKLVKRFQVLQPPVLPRPHFAQIATELDKTGIFLRLFALLPSQDLIDLGEHEPSPLAVQLGRKRRMLSN